MSACERGNQVESGRWLSPDPLGGDVTNPQSLNRYAYALNNPTTFVDPLGLFVTPGENPFSPGCTVDSLAMPCGFIGMNSVLACGSFCGAVGYGRSYSGSGGGNGDYSLIAGVNGWTWLNDLNGEELSPESAAEIGLPGTLGFDLGSGFGQGAGGAGTGGSGGGSTAGCTGRILGAVNNQFGTNFTSADVGTGAYAPFQWPEVPGGTVNIDIFPPQGQAGGISPGRYPVNWWTYVIGYGATLHVPAGPGGLDSPSTLNFSDTEFTAHLDSAYAYNPIGLLFHLSGDVFGTGGHHPCP